MFTLRREVIGAVSSPLQFHSCTPHASLACRPLVWPTEICGHQSKWRGLVESSDPWPMLTGIGPRGDSGAAESLPLTAFLSRHRGFEKAEAGNGGIGKAKARKRLAYSSLVP